MWDRAELKRRGKEAFMTNYWKCVLVSFILAVLTASNSSNSNGSQSGYTAGVRFHLFGFRFNPFAGVFILSAALISIAVGLVITIFIKNPLKVGCANFYLRNAEGPCSIACLADAYRDGQFINIFITMFMSSLYIFLYSLLLVVPGIMKAYSYRMVPYILAEKPYMDWKAVLQESEDMMYGNRLDAFILDISFIGWELLSSITWGIAGYLFVNPYMDATKAELYRELKQLRA